MAVHPEEMRILSLCSGIGGLELGIKLAREQSECVCYVEGEAYASSLLVRRMEEGVLDEAPIWSDVRSFDGKPWRGKVDCITGGYPCQPFSTAGKQLHADDPRHLFPHIKRIIEEVRPKRCFFENVANHLRLGFEQVHDELQSMGFRVAAGLFTATESGASHRRERLYIMADAEDGALPDVRPRPNVDRSGLQAADLSDSSGGEDFPQQWKHLRCNAAGGGVRMDGMVFPPEPADIQGWKAFLDRNDGVEPAVPRLAHGTPRRVDRTRACGNGVIPLVAAYAWTVLENSFKVQ